MGISASSIADTMVEKQRALQKEMQKEMAEVQARNMRLNQEKMARMMVVQNMALTRERLNWMGGFGILATLAALGHSIKTKHASPLTVPLVPYWTIIGYQWDFAYGDKVNRIKKEVDQIMKDERYWFNESKDQ
eukprot:TRINITY_DN13633_c0_g1_i1.p1 TRINITY_DN13633_c0_g1~~TRINITY_DN13633_c0_g1_i1.p1  ORF type:complete len:133 (+),score=33.66 TRINITY_DN13633_c0_g1_i1:24-422(+)